MTPPSLNLECCEDSEISESNWPTEKVTFDLSCPTESIIVPQKYGKSALYLTKPTPNLSPSI